MRAGVHWLERTQGPGDPCRLRRGGDADVDHRLGIRSHDVGPGPSPDDADIERSAGGGVLPGVDLDDSAGLLDRMDGRR